MESNNQISDNQLMMIIIQMYQPHKAMIRLCLLLVALNLEASGPCLSTDVQIEGFSICRSEVSSTQVNLPLFLLAAMDAMNHIRKQPPKKLKTESSSV